MGYLRNRINKRTSSSKKFTLLSGVKPLSAIFDTNDVSAQSQYNGFMEISTAVNDGKSNHICIGIDVIWLFDKSRSSSDDKHSSL